jgi:small GTP-binding protein
MTDLAELDLTSGNDVSIKVVVIGDAAVGKSCLLLSYANNAFPEDWIPTVFDNYTAHVVHNEVNVTLGLWDTAGTEEYDTQRPLSYPNTHVFVIVYDITNAASLQNIEKKWVKEIKPFTNDGQIPFIIVGNKLDLRGNAAFKDKVIKFSEAEKLGKKLGAKRVLETSAKTQENLKHVFDECVQVVAEALGPKVKKTGSKNCKQQ